MKKSLFSIALVILLPFVTVGQGNSAFSGKWTLLPQMSHDIGLFANLTIDIRPGASTVVLIHKWGTSRSFVDSLSLQLGGAVNTVSIRDRVWPANVFMGLAMPIGGKREFKATWEKGGSILKVVETYAIRGSQGNAPISTIHTYELSDANEILVYTVARSSRTSGPPVKYVLKRAGTNEAYVMRLEDNWEIQGKLPVHAFLISLQGLANDGTPRLYFIYPPKWDFTYTEDVFKFLKEKRHYTFRELATPQAALQTFKNSVKGYVVWDKSVRTSLTVAFTVAGLERAVVVSEEMIPMVESAGLKPVADFRGKFSGQSDAQIYKWAYDQYWNRCSKDYIVWMGGERGTIMKPGVADFGIAKQAFFNDLSCRKTDTVEYQLARKILSDMKPMSMVMGWHSYAKDLEREYVTLTSNFGLRVEGLHTLPNISFSSQVPPSPGFKFTNNHRLEPGKIYKPEKKVYISCIQTDGIGLGAWLEPGRGEMPVAWEVLMNYVWMAPAMAEYFYTVATPNDYFIGCLSGPGYMYPKAVPPKFLPGLLAKAKEDMDILDLRVFETMDYSEGATVEGNSDLPKEIIDAYYKAMPNAIGFVNGYAPSYTFTTRDGKPFISYDYYLSPERPEADAAADLEELARINSKRPYFLLMHVREYSNVKRMKAILDRLGPEFEVVPLDVFLTLAGKEPTFKERYLQKGELQRPDKGAFDE
ncbi:MAG: GxGYxYP family putative glycoside hydrolase [Ignavibacteria bacterium]|nr:GxGYxYP family putative glycoside hydrolase [Ignavibacteria bacterium]